MFYLIQVTLCWAIFYALYWLMYRQETFFVANRLYLLLTLVLGLLLPLDFSKLLFVQNTSNNEYITVYLRELSVGASQMESATKEFSLSYQHIIYAVYGVGVLFFAIRFLIGLIKIYTIKANSQIKQCDGYFLAKTKEIHLPFSFWNTIYWSEEVENDALILRHEVAHIQQRHSIDVLFVELLSIVFWCSPLVYCYKKSLRAVHEYLADAAATQAYSKQEYGAMLIRQLQSGMQPTIANSFISSQIKQRFAMMLKSSSPCAAYIKYIVCAPLIFILSVLLHQESLKAQEVFTDENGLKTIKYTDFNIVENMDTIVRFDPATLKESINFNKRTDTVYQKLEIPAEFVGGQTELMKYLGSEVKYPKEAREKKQEGRSVIQFVVSKTGFVESIKVRKSSGFSLLDEEAKRIILTMNKGFYADLNDLKGFTPKSLWKPGSKNGKAVACYFTLPIGFKLEK